ncbi:MAG: hypothetical protein B6242_16335 [Anaerolineaceae bacterium 4572_78]|nr:MAG: hypothetical protein B6242_16335 [Anaerolineaceae bacterium 4572_78]
MTLTFDIPAEAFITVGMVIIAADGEATDPEFLTIGKYLETLDVFKEYDEDKIGELFEKTGDTVFQSLHKTREDITAFNNEEINIIFDACKAILDPRHFQPLFNFAVEIAHSDGLHPNEEKILNRLQEEFGIGDTSVLKFYHPGEAYVAIAIATVLADGEVTDDEFESYIKNLRQLTVFETYAENEINDFINSAKDRISDSLNRGFENLTPFTESELAILATASKVILSTQQRQESLRMATRIAESDGLSQPEENLLTYLQAEFSSEDARNRFIPIGFSHASEAFIGIGMAIIIADGDLSKNELRKLKNVCQTLDIFKEEKIGDIENVILETGKKIFAACDRHDNFDKTVPFTQIELESMIDSAKKILNPELCETVYLMAVELAYTTPITESEQTVLDCFQRRLEISHHVALMINDVVAMKHRSFIASVPPIRFNSPMEAFMALGMAVILADDKTTEVEFNTFFGGLTMSILFRGLKRNEIADMWNKTAKKILTTFKKNKGKPKPFTPEEVDSLIKGCKHILNSKLRETFFVLAVETAYVDGLSESEQILLDQLQAGLEIDTIVADKIREVIMIKHRTTLSALHFDNPSEAFVALGLAVAIADHEANPEEFEALGHYLSRLDAFPEYDELDLSDMWDDTVEKVFTAFNRSDDFDELIPFMEDEVAHLVEACNEILIPELRETAFVVGVEVAYVDGLHEKEVILLEQLQKGLKIDSEIARKIMDVVSLKYAN